MTNEFDVVVIGAGLSGLRAALEIHRAGLSFVVLEALDSVGGKLPVGGGGSWINDSSQTEIHALAQLFGLDLVKQYISGTFLYQKKDGNVVPYPLGFGPVSSSLLRGLRNLTLPGRPRTRCLALVRDARPLV